MARQRKAPRKVPVLYKDYNNVEIEYVARPPGELRTELRRVQQSILDAIRILSKMKRIRHSVIRTASFQLDHALRDIPSDAQEGLVAQELARLSFLMEDTLNILNQLSQCRVANLEAARFKLTYGQTPKKREPPAKYGRRSRRKEDDV